MSERVVVEGCKEAEEALGELSKKITRKICRKGCRAGAKLWLTAARAEAPERSGKTKRAIKIRAAKAKGGVAVSVGVGAKDFTGTTFYASFVLYGHRIGKRSLGESRKMQPANNFLLRAYNTAKASAADTALDTISKLIEENREE